MAHNRGGRSHRLFWLDQFDNSVKLRLPYWLRARARVPLEELIFIMGDTRHKFSKINTLCFNLTFWRYIFRRLFYFKGYNFFVNIMGLSGEKDGATVKFLKEPPILQR